MNTFVLGYSMYVVLNSQFKLYCIWGSDCMSIWVPSPLLMSNWIKWCIKYMYMWRMIAALHYVYVLPKPAHFSLTHPTLVAQWSCWRILHCSLPNRCNCQCPLQWCWGGSDCSPVSCCPPGLCWWSLWEVLPGPQLHCGARWCWREGSCPQCSWRRQGLGRSPLGWLRCLSCWGQL